LHPSIFPLKSTKIHTPWCFVALLALFRGCSSQLDPLAPWPFTFGDQQRRSQSPFTGPVIGAPVLQWSYPLPGGGKAYHPPVVTSAGAVAFYSYTTNTIVSLNASTGAWRWATTHSGSGLIGGQFWVTISAAATGALWAAINSRLSMFEGATGVQTNWVTTPGFSSANGGVVLSKNNTLLVTDASQKLYGCWAPLFPTSACTTINLPLANGGQWILGSPAVSNLDGSIFIQSYNQ
jgi:hypothetical protein